MSIFSVIKYQISCPPTVEELEALPSEIYNKWTDISIITIVRVLNIFWKDNNLESHVICNRKSVTDMVEGLRLIIKDMDE